MGDLVVRAILLVPQAGALPGLLAEGPCGARPPLVYRELNVEQRYDAATIARLRLGNWSERGQRASDVEAALVLAWRGAVVPDGRDRAARILRGRGWWSNTPTRLRRWITGDFTATHLLDPKAPVRVVLVDADGREVPRG